jgi:hypothetical protein
MYISSWVPSETKSVKVAMRKFLEVLKRSAKNYNKVLFREWKCEVHPRTVHEGLEGE